MDYPRGPDAKYRVRVPEEWLEDGRKVDVRLPRNLACATCGGGGCDACRGSGAVTLRERHDPDEIVTVTLPKMNPAPESGARAIVLRIPDAGGYPPPDEDLPRGLLLLSVVPDLQADASVSLWSEGAPPFVSPRSARVPSRAPVLALAAVVLVWIVLLVYLRVTGQG